MHDVFTSDLLVGKVAFVTGGTSGINHHIALRYAKAGARVALIGRNVEKAEAAAAVVRKAGGEAVGLSADVRDYAGLEGAFKAVHDRWGEIDIVIAGAAGNFVAPVLGMSSNGFRTVIDIDLVGTFNTVRAAFAFLRRPGAAIIAISASHSTMPVAAQAHVCAAKAGIDMLIKSLSLEWGSQGVRCLGIAPGAVENTEGMRRLAPNGAENLQQIFASIPLGRQATRDDIADLALFLVSGAANYINGTIISIDGGSLNSGGQRIGEMLMASVEDARVERGHP
ncbi:SDR family oxidoreductase [Paraburkholderia metrosideri]|uniref:SDR family oxidoreductase n=1 Tax=Paraburkholderia metrosideri TaxID=580937 RepID=A0ABW9DZM8_9BURK